MKYFGKPCKNEKELRLALLEAADVIKELALCKKGTTKRETVHSRSKARRKKWGVPKGLGTMMWFEGQLRLSAGCDFP